LLVNSIEQDPLLPRDTQIVFPAELIVRASTGTPAVPMTDRKNSAGSEPQTH
jgi:hypothetical protein